MLIKHVFVTYFMKKRDIFSTNLLDKLIVSQVVRFSTFHGTWRFIIMFSMCHQCVCFKPDEFSPWPPILFLEHPFYYYPLTSARDIKVVSCLHSIMDTLNMPSNTAVCLVLRTATCFCLNRHYQPINTAF